VLGAREWTKEDVTEVGKKILSPIEEAEAEEDGE